MIILYGRVYALRIKTILFGELSQKLPVEKMDSYHTLTLGNNEDVSAFHYYFKIIQK